MNKQNQDIKIKGLKPTLRLKKRFVLIKVNSKKKLDFANMSKLLNERLTYFLGAIDISKHAVWIIKDYFDLEKQEVLIKVSTKLKDKLIAAILLIEKLGKEDVKIETLKVSGTLKGIRSYRKES